jgi:hypothetical protein
MFLGAISTSAGSERMKVARTLCSVLLRRVPAVLGAEVEVACEGLSSFGSSGRYRMSADSSAATSAGFTIRMCV